MYSIEVPFANIEQIYKSGQVFRWIRFSDTKYVIPFKDKAVKVFQQRKRLVFDCSEETFYDLWYNYFDIQTDYVEINYKMQRMSNEMKPLANRGNGVRIIRQDLEEMLITYAIGGNNFQQIKSNIQNLCILCGKKRTQSMKELGKVTWHEMPSSETILKNKQSIESSYLFKHSNPTFDLLFNVCNEISLGLTQKLIFKDYVDSYNLLCSIGYSSLKAKLCILHGMHRLNIYADTNKLKCFVNELAELDKHEFRDAIKSKGLNNYKGYVRQVLVYNMTNPPKGGWQDGAY